MSLAIFNSPIDAGPVALAGPLVKVVSIAFPGAAPPIASTKWVIIGKVVIRNSHATVQPAAAELLAGATLLDKTIVLVPANGSLCLSLEGTLTGVAGALSCVQISCMTATGFAELAQLIAISVDGLQPGHPC